MNTVQHAVDHVGRIVDTSGSSFSLGMRILPPMRRRAMYALYAFCREVDDVADGPGNPAEKLNQLANWREEVSRIYEGTPTHQTARALAPHAMAFNLPRQELQALIEGVEMDARQEMVAPSRERLDIYCRNVAGAVGLLSIRIFEEPHKDAQDFAVALGHALQLTNILRDIDEDARLGRLYLPRELLIKHGIDPCISPAQAVHDPRIAAACRDLAIVARRSFRKADHLLLQCDRRRLRGALVMFGIYERLLGALEAKDWQAPRRRVRLSSPVKIWSALSGGLFRPKWRPST